MPQSGGSLPRGEYAHGMRYLQRSDLDEEGLRVHPADLAHALGSAYPPETPLPISLLEVVSVPRIAGPASPSDPECSYLSKDILAGLNGQGLPLYFVLRGEPRRVGIFIGTFSSDATAGPALRAMVASQYPGIQFSNEPSLGPDAGEANSVTRLRSFLAQCQHVGVLTGVPTPRPAAEGGAGTQIDRLIRGAYGADWAFVVMADPLEDQALVEMQMAALREQLHVEQEEGLREWRERNAQTVATHYMKMLEMRRQFLEACLYEGGWLTQCYVCAKDERTYQRARALVRAVFSGDHARVDRIRVLNGGGAGPKAASLSPILGRRTPAGSAERAGDIMPRLKYHTLVSSGQLSAFVHMPRIEAPGFFIRDAAPFDVTPHVQDQGPSVRVGEILDRGRETGNDYRVLLPDLTRHCLIVGLTGSGKTKTSHHVLRQLAECEPPVNFLVIEPAKREYRELAAWLPPGRTLRVFTLGQEGEGAAPFRLNPFEIRRGASVQSHIDVLKAVFNASFGMWSPLPQVLERAIHELYQDKGWDTVRSTNARGLLAGDTGWHPRAQPTLTDLYRKIGDLVPALGYDEEVQRNVRTALETRVNGLRIGAKGLMLDTAQSVPVEFLLDGPTVLELEGVGDDEEKAFIMGLVLMAIYEHHRASRSLQAKGRDASGDRGQALHVTVVEEAHRLLANAPASNDPASANLRGKAVETFVNMLSEVRAYGEGFIIAEQIATKLAPDVVKNTALKIMHRTVSNDDRQLMGGAMNLDPAQMRQVVSLDPGVAVVHGGGQRGDDNAMLVRAPRPLESRPLTNAEVQAGWERFVKEHGLSAAYRPYPTCEANCRASGSACSEARAIAEDAAVEESFAAFLLSLTLGAISRDEAEMPALLRELFGGVERSVRTRLKGVREEVPLVQCVLTHCLYRYLDRSGAQYGWSYQKAADMAETLLPCLATAAAGHAPGATDAAGLAGFCKEYRDGCELSYEPFYGCRKACGQTPTCLCRLNVARLVPDAVLDGAFVDLRPGSAELRDVCEDAAERALAFGQVPGFPATAMDDQSCQTAALCFLIQKTHASPAAWPVPNRRAEIDRLLAVYGH